ncbi:GIY-YIG nuclease family protein [Canibacter sp. lx-72]|uniref:GIY-YIG nuclease family protein n=1 Tax=Canibacter zhuwentaonis TaxID=2837491 RepID=UPI001BDD0AE1|nr:GIY-YIG nuclease family protein [Canibacter zhuwentaonis]MBT1018016.1 GIY-YIG nuclease family protein [Canibacter zhuwentaonis]MBT1035457.1 GIY-YIG nuclease family protein [Canibacter zhuwentaonis]
MSRGKSLNLYLMDGTPSGLIKCTLANWTGLAYKIPRTLLAQAKRIDFLNQTGVYFLFGEDGTTGDPQCYIGQAGVRKNGRGIHRRLDEHKRSDKEGWWTTAIAFTTSHNSFGPTEVSYLENRFYNMAAEAGRYQIRNGKDPNPGNITEEKENELEEYIDYAKIVMGAFGYKLFEPLREKLVAQIQEPEFVSNEPVLYLKYSQAQATGQRTAEGFIVFAGSRISLKLNKSVGNGTRKRRERYAEKIDSQGILLADLLFSSPSGAAAFVGGASLSGNAIWKTEGGMSLGQLKSQ